MNTKHILAAVALAFAATGAVHAQEIVPEAGPAAVSQKTRAQVQAELKLARAEGQLAGVGELAAQDRTPFVSTLTRAQVHAEAVKATANGGFRNLLAEYGGSNNVTPAAEQTTRMAGK